MIASDAVSRAVLDKYNSFQAKLRPSDDQFTVLASIVAYKKTREEVRVLSIATGTKCCGHSLIDNYVPGSILVDSHAEILSRRGFIRYLLNTIRLCLEDPSLELSDDVLIERKGDRWGFKDSWEVFLYVSDPPCGDCAIYDRDDHGKQSMNFTGAKLLVDTPGSTVDATGQDKEETDDEGTHHKRWRREDMGEAQALGCVRLKPIRSDTPVEKQTRAVSCSDKYVRANPWHSRFFFFSITLSPLNHTYTSNFPLLCSWNILPLNAAEYLGG